MEFVPPNNILTLTLWGKVTICLVHGKYGPESMSGLPDSGHSGQFWGHCSFSPLSLFLEPLEIVCIYVSLFDVLFARSSNWIHSATRKTILMFQEMVIFWNLGNGFWIYIFLMNLFFSDDVFVPQTIQIFCWSFFSSFSFRWQLP